MCSNRKNRSARKWIGEPVKIVARLNPEQYKRANAIKEKYGFKSVYEINQYLWASFLRVADPKHEENTDPVPDEIETMFCDYSNAERRFEYVKPKKNLPQYQIDEINGQQKLNFKE